MHRILIGAVGSLVVGVAAMVAGPVAADACAGLIGSNGAVNLGRTTTLAAYHDGVEHYVTAFQVLLEQRIDALDIMVLKGGAPDVAAWATEHGFRLSVDAPEVLDFYARRSPIFLAAVFDGQAALDRGQKVGDGTPVHLTIPLDN